MYLILHLYHTGLIDSSVHCYIFLRHLCKNFYGKEEALAFLAKKYLGFFEDDRVYAFVNNLQ